MQRKRQSRKKKKKAHFNRQSLKAGVTLGVWLFLATHLIISENDPWLEFQDALQLAKAWNLNPVNLGQVGHINVASGFGAFPELEKYLISEKPPKHINISDVNKYFFKFAI